MSNLPTLMIPGKLRSPVDNEDLLTPEFKEELRTAQPLEYILNWFKTRMHLTGIQNRFLVLKSETASGKSTSLPPAIYRKFIHNNNGPGLVCTQPRVLTAIENVNEMLKWNSDILRLGTTAGWSTQHNKMKPQKTSLLSATIGTLSQQLKVMTDAEILLRYKFILIDETHERDLQTDFTIYMLKNLLNRTANKQECPFVVLMSATFDPDPLLRYFNAPRMTNFIWCAGATAKIDEMWDYAAKIKKSSYIEAAAECVEHICMNGEDDIKNKGDILIFLPGGGEMSQMSIILEKINKRLITHNYSAFSILKIDSEAVNYYTEDFKKLIDVELEDQLIKIDDKIYIPKRRVIMSTNVAETGLTLDGLKYVVDAGYNRETEYNPVYGTVGLITKPAPRSRIRQRRGRSGRKFPGVFYPLYTEDIHNKLPLLQLPQILTSDVSTIMIDVIKEQLKMKKAAGLPIEFRIKDIDLIDHPTPDAISSCLYKLHSLGFIAINSPDNVDFDVVKKSTLDQTLDKAKIMTKSYGLTPLGVIASRFGSMAPELVRMILAGYSWNIFIPDLIAVAIYLQMDAEKGIAGASAEWRRNNPGKTVPGINWVNIYKLALGKYFSEDSLLYKVRLIISDTMLDGLFLMNAIIELSRADNLFKSISQVRDWCEANFVSYERAVKMLQSRDEIIEMMLIEGFDVFTGKSLSTTPERKFMNYICNIKHCIYDGFRCNLITYNGSEYRTVNNLKVNTPSLFKSNEKNSKEASRYQYAIETLPTTMVYYKLDLQLSKKNNLFEVKAAAVSALDGYIPIDNEF